MNQTNKKKITFITINSLNELSGGGIYARTIAHSLLENGQKLSVIDKSIPTENQYFNFVEHHFSLKKNIFTDLVSRLLLSPTYSFFYVIKIIKFINNNKSDYTFLHNSRLGLVSIFLRSFTSTKLIGNFDNQESYLSYYQFKKTNNLMHKFVRFFDFVVLKMSESIFIKSCHALTFITEKDKSNYNYDCTSIILPVCLPVSSNNFSSAVNFDVLFTGSFSFAPNIQAYSDFIQLSKNHPELRFVVAGRGLSSIVKKNYHNVTHFCSPTDSEMKNIFESSRTYISPVNDGSGMKTKIAEALSFGLYVLASKHSVIGYEEILEKDCLTVYSGDLNEAFTKWYKRECEFNKWNAQQVFNEFYSYSIAQARIKGIINEL